MVNEEFALTAMSLSLSGSCLCPRIGSLSLCAAAGRDDLKLTLHVFILPAIERVVVRAPAEQVIAFIAERAVAASRTVRDPFNQTTFTLDDEGRTFGVIVRAYYDGVAVRYDLP